jgi:hypothetical protein
MVDGRNIKILRDVYGAELNREFEKFYYDVLRQQLVVWSDDKPNLLLLSRIQSGGSLYRLTTTNGEYLVEVELVEGMYTTDDGEEVRHRLLFFHPKWSERFNGDPIGFNRQCLSIILYPKDRYGELNSYWPCFQIVSRELAERRAGYRIVQAAIYYCRKNRTSLGIDRLELGDNATYYCVGNRHRGINLGLSCQLLGEYPYYWQFGFRPSTEIIAIIEANLDLVYSKTTGGCLGTDGGLNEFLVKYKLDPDIMRYVSEHQSQSLIETLKYISSNYCNEYRKFYEDLYVMLGLNRIEG